MKQLVLWAHRRRAMVLSIAAGLVVASLFGMRGLTLDADVVRLLPRDGVAIPPFRTFLERFGSLDQLYVVFTAAEGFAAEDYEEEIDAWVGALRAAPEIERVDAGAANASRDWNYLADRQLLLLPEPALGRALDRLRPEGMAPAIAETRELLGVPSPEIAALARQDPLGLLTLLREHLGSAGEGAAGAMDEGYVSADGRQRLVIAHPARPPYDPEFSRALFERLERIRAQVAASTGGREPADAMVDDAPPPLRVEFAGGHRIAIETEAVVRRESIVNGIGSLALILPLLYVVFRSPWLVAVGAIPSALSLLVVLGILGLTGATLSAAAAGASAMLFGLGVDGVVLLYVAHRLALASGAAPDAAVAQTAGPSSSMLLGMWTTAATFYGLLVVDFPSLEQLGGLIGHSMVVCGVLTLILVPALLPGRPGAAGRRLLSLPRLAAFVGRRSGFVLVVAAVATVALGAAATRLRVHPTLDRLRSVTPAATLEHEIGRAFGLPSDVYVVLAEGADLETLLRANERLAAHLRRDLPGVRVHAPTMLLPSLETQDARAALIATSVGAPPAVRAALRQAAAEGGFRPGTTEPFEARLDRLLDPSLRLSHDGYARERLDALLGRFVTKADEGRWTLATYVYPESPGAVAALEAVVSQQPGGQQLTGMALVNRELAARFLPQFLLGLAAGSAIVIVLILATFRDVRLSLLSLLPTAVGLLWAAGLLGLAGVELDLFAVFAVLTFVGIGVDYGIHMIHRYRDRGSAEQACAELAPVILVAGAITLIGYGTLTTSSYPPLRSIGVVSLVSVVTLVASSLFVLPALLVRERR